MALLNLGGRTHSSRAVLLVHVDHIAQRVRRSVLETDVSADRHVPVICRRGREAAREIRRDAMRAALQIPIKRAPRLETRLLIRR